jgi:hypothetical protein
MFDNIHPNITYCNRENHGLGCGCKEREKEMSKVYVTQENPRVNIVSAARWGDLEPLTNPFDQIHINPIRLVVQIRRKLRRATDEDWLLAMGDPAIIGVAFSIFTEMNQGRVNLLKWDKMEKSYYPVKINLRAAGIENLNPDEEKRYER